MLKVTKDRVLVRPDKRKEQTENGIYIPDTGRDQPVTGQVIGIGPEVDTLSEGDRIYFSAYAGVTFEHEDESLLIMGQEEALGIIVDDEEDRP